MSQVVAITGGEVAGLVLSGIALLVGGSSWFLIRSSAIGQYADAASKFNATISNQHDEIENMQDRIFALETDTRELIHWLETSDEVVIGLVEYVKDIHGDDLAGFNGRYSLWQRQRATRKRRKDDR